MKKDVCPQPESWREGRNAIAPGHVCL